MAHLLESVLWQGMKQLEPKSRLGGILANKPGYHNTRSRLRRSRPWDYSIRWPLDLLGPSDAPAAIDWTFPDAQAGRYGTIAKYSKRLLDAGRVKDPRVTRYLREFYGNADSDREVEGWDYVRHKAASSDSSHLWHIHISVRRKYVNDRKAMDAILSVLKGERLYDWQIRWGEVKAPVPPKGTYKVRSGDTLTKIAAVHKVDVADLIKWNNITKPNFILVGQTLLITAPSKPKPPTVVKAPKWPKGPKDYFRPRNSIPHYETVEVWQAQMKKRGWDIVVDGYLGPDSGRVLKAFQIEKGLKRTGVLDQATFEAAWTAPVT